MLKHSGKTICMRHLTIAVRKHGLSVLQDERATSKTMPLEHVQVFPFSS